MNKLIDDLAAKEINNVFVSENDPIHYVLKALTIVLSEIFMNHPGEFKWDNNDENTHLWIINTLSYNRPQLDKAPAIVLSVTQGAWGEVGMDNLLTFDMQTGIRLFTDLIRLGITFYCVGKDTFQAERLTIQTFMLLKYFHHEIESLGIFSVRAGTFDVHPSNRPQFVLPELSVGMTNAQVTLQRHWEKKNVTTKLYDKIEIDLFEPKIEEE